MAMDGNVLQGLCEGAEGASGWMTVAASFPNPGQPCEATGGDKCRPSGSRKSNLENIIGYIVMEV